MTCTHSRQTDGQLPGPNELPRHLPCAYPGCPEGWHGDTYRTAVMERPPGDYRWASLNAEITAMKSPCREVLWKREQMTEAKPLPARPGGPDERVTRTWWFWRQVP